MTDKTTASIETPLAPARLFGAAQRIAGDPARVEEIDRRFSAAKGMISGYVLSAPGAPGKNVRDLVSVGLVDPNNACAIALSERSGDPAQPEKPVDIAHSLMRESKSRDMAVEAAALKRRLATNGLAPAQAAGVFEKLAAKAQAGGDMAAAKTAALGFAEQVAVGIEARDRNTPGRRAALVME